MKKIDLMNEAECREHSITTAEQLAEQGWTVELDEVTKLPHYLVRDSNGNLIFDAENINGLEPWMITDCIFHHGAYTSDYVSVYSGGKFAPYHGRYGEGYTVTINDEKIKRCFKFYYIK